MESQDETIQLLEEKAQEYVDLFAAIADTRARMDELKGDILMLAREAFPQAWEATVEHQEQAMTLCVLPDGTKVQIPIRRVYDPDAVRAQFGETDPELVDAAIEVKESVVGRRMENLWRSMATRHKVAACLKPGPAPSLRVERPQRKA